MTTQLTHAELFSALAYQPDSGVFTWKKTGAIAGGPNFDGYIKIKVHQRWYLAHRLAWLYVHGIWPTQLIDHINGDRVDNRIANLRDVSNSVNRQNARTANADSKTGILGVTLRKSKSKPRYQAQIAVNGKNKYLGMFDTEGEAHQAYLMAKREVHIGCTI